MPAPGPPAHGLQLWVNLAAKDKMVPPAYQEVRHLPPLFTPLFTGGVGSHLAPSALRSPVALLCVCSRLCARDLMGVLSLAADGVLTADGGRQWISVPTAAAEQRHRQGQCGGGAGGGHCRRGAGRGVAGKPRSSPA